MGWFLLESLLALGVAAFIVWWTMAPKRKKPPRAPGARDGRG